MSSKTSFVKQAAILAMASILVRFMGFLYRLPLTALIGDMGMGIYGRAYNFYSFLFVLSSAGLPAAISKMVSMRSARNEHANAYKVFKVSLRVSAVTGLVAALVLGLGAKSLSSIVDPPGDPSSMYAILSLAPTVFIVAILSAFRGYFQGLRNNVPTAVSQLAEQVFNAVFSVYMAYALIKHGIEFGAAGGTIGTGIGAFAGLSVIMLIYFIGAGRSLSEPLRVSDSELLAHAAGKKNFPSAGSHESATESGGSIAIELFKTAIPVIAGAAVFSFTNIVDNITVSECLLRSGAFTSERITELFGQLEGKYVTMVTLPVSLAAAMATTVVPHIAAIKVSDDRASLHNKINLALKLTMLLSIPAAAGIGSLSQPILSMLFPRHPEGGSLLAVGAVSIIFLALTNITAGMLQGVGQVKVPAAAAFMGVLVKLPVNFILISNPDINIHGAVIGTIACYMVASAIDLAMLVRCTGVKVAWRDIFLKPGAAACVMGVCCYLFYSLMRYSGAGNAASCLLAVCAGAIVYTVYMLKTGGVTADDMTNIPGGERMTAVFRRCGFLI